MQKIRVRNEAIAIKPDHGPVREKGSSNRRPTSEKSFGKKSASPKGRSNAKGKPSRKKS